MHLLLDELMRRRVPAGTRWREWAAAFAARRARIAAGVRASGVLLSLRASRPGAAARHATTVMRWSPRISVAILIHAATRARQPNAALRLATGSPPAGTPPGRTPAPRPAADRAPVPRTVVSRVRTGDPARVPVRSMLRRGRREGGRESAVRVPAAPPARATVSQPPERWRSRRRGGAAAAPALGALRTTVRQLVRERHRIEVPLRPAAGAGPLARATTTAVLAGVAPAPAPRSSGFGDRPRDAMVLRPAASPPRGPGGAGVPCVAGHRAEAGRPAGAPPQLTATDLGLLTDQVVQQIDRRIVAHRERQGRM